MPNEKSQSASLDKRLRQNVPPLRAPDPVRVTKACARIASAPPLSPLRQPHTFTRPLARVAACALLLFGVAVLMRRQPPPTTTVRSPLPSVADFRDLTALMDTPEWDNTLTGEAACLVADLTDLTAALNERTFAILF